MPAELLASGLSFSSPGSSHPPAVMGRSEQERTQRLLNQGQWAQPPGGSYSIEWVCTQQVGVPWAMDGDSLSPGPRTEGLEPSLSPQTSKRNNNQEGNVQG